MFHPAGVLEGVERSGWYGMVLLTKSFAVKCVKLCNHEPGMLQGTATTVIAEGCAGAPELPGLNPEETLEPITNPPAVKASQQQAEETVQGYACLPWRVAAVDSSKGPSWEQEVANYMAAAACGISPAYHGSCIIHHSEKQPYSRLKNCTGFFINAPWLRNLVCTELRKLHSSSPHTDSPVGCFMMTRVPYTLASYPGDPQGLDAKDLNMQLQSLHWCAIAHGLVQLISGQPTWA